MTVVKSARAGEKWRARGAAMNSMMDDGATAGVATGRYAPAFSGRERDRARAFEPVWDGALHSVFADVAPYYWRASNWASLGLYGVWVRRFVSAIECPPAGRVLDVCAGTNALGIRLLERRPDLQLSAIDRSVHMQAEGQRLARGCGVAIAGTIGDAHDLPFPDGHFDTVTLGFASRHLRVAEVFAQVHRVLRPGGRFYHIDMLRPANRLVEGVYCLFLKASVTATGAIFGSSPEARSCTDYFVEGIHMFYSAAEISEILREVGFNDIRENIAPAGVLGFHGARKE